MDFLARKILNGRVFENTEKKKMWDLSVVSMSYEVLLVSQFTLCGKFKGNTPTYHNALPPQEAKEKYDKFVDLLRARYDPDKIKDGVFGAKMNVNLVNDGPVTFVLDSEER